MATALSVAALAATLAGALCLYFGAPRQQWLARPWPALPARAGGLALLLLAWGLWGRIMAPVAALFTVLTLAMPLAALVPTAFALAAQSRKERP